MFWADRIAKDIIASGKYRPYWVDDMKTPSGRIHVGSLRGVVIHDLVYKALLHVGAEAIFTWVFEDHDPMDALPHYLDAKKWSKYLGQPLFTIPSPDGNAQSFAHYFAYEFKEVFNKIDCSPAIIWTSDLYKTGRMNKDIKTCLDNVKTIREIYETMYKKKLPDNWYPFQVVCPRCTKESTTRVDNWDGKEVTFECKIDAVDWTKGCGYVGKINPFSGNGKFVGKLSWKVEWPVKWKVIGVTIEGAGKDHMSAGGSHDIAKQVCEQVLHYPVPYPVAYEFFLVGGMKMSSSKGLGTSAIEISQVLPPYLLRFLFTRTDYNEAINFEPVGKMYIPDLFDEYDRCWNAYITGSDENLVRAFEMSQIGNPPQKQTIFLPRFKDVINYVQHPSINIKQKFTEVKGSELTFIEAQVLKERQEYAKIWLEKYAPAEFRYHMSVEVPELVAQLSKEQKIYLQEIISLLSMETPEELQLALYNKAKELRVDIKKAFSAIYTAFIGKTHGPKAAWFLLQYPKKKVVQRLKEAIEYSEQAEEQKDVQLLSRPDLFSIHPDVRQKYPSISIGVAIIRGITVKSQDADLEKEKQVFLESLSGLTTKSLGEFPEITSYRKLYKEMGVDWHSRRPTTEALLRRVALEKGLYTINTCVDAYNLIVMKQRVSLGAFDLDQMKLPAVLRFAKKGESILLLGDSQPTQYTEKELAYFDQIGGYNIDFNYRDAKRTMVTEKIKNVWINVDGVYDITPEKVQETLKEATEKIVKYCGGTVEFQGVIT